MARRRLQEPYSCASHSQALAVGSASECQPQQKQNSRPRRARVRSSTDRAGRPDRTHDWHRASARQNWLAEPGLQHSAPCDAGADRRRMRVETVLESTPRADKRAPRWRQSYATNYRSALVAITSRTNIVRGAPKTTVKKSRNSLRKIFLVKEVADQGDIHLGRRFNRQITMEHGNR